MHAVFFIIFYFNCAIFAYPRGNLREKRNVSEASNNNEVMNYLHEYGYLENMENMTDEKMKTAIMEFQHFIGITPTGEINKETTEMMRRPRCGRPDIIRTRAKRYTFFGNRTWEKPELTFNVKKPTNKLDGSLVNDEMQKALNVWAEYTEMKFKASDEGQLDDISIYFQAIDGIGEKAGYAYKPTRGVVVFDVDEKWTKDDDNEGINLFQIAVHEFGHSLGLGHSEVMEAIMYPMYMGYIQNFSLHDDDIRGIKILYEPQFTTYRRLTFSGNNTLLCKNPKIDAMFSANGGFLYLLKNDQYWKLTLEFNLVEGPKLISSRWPSAPSNVDAAFTAPNKLTYFFKGPHFWKYTLDGKFEGTKLISAGFRGIPENLDAGMVWNGNGRIYFFKGEDYWKFDTQKPPSMRIKHTYPYPISRWNGLPNNLDAAVAVGRATYFFKGGKYYKFDTMNFRVEEGYPRSTLSLFGCN